MFDHEGITRENTHRYSGKYVGVWANNDTMAFTIPDYERGSWNVKNLSCWTETGAAGAKVRTISAPNLVYISAFDEATGIATITNGSGGGITNPFFTLDLIGGN